MNLALKIVLISFFTLIFTGENQIIQYLQAQEVITNTLGDLEDESNEFIDYEKIIENHFINLRFNFLTFFDNNVVFNLHANAQLSRGFANIETPPPNNI